MRRGGSCELIVIGTGVETGLVAQGVEKLQAERVRARGVDAQPGTFRAAGPGVPRFRAAAERARAPRGGSRLREGWARWIGDAGATLTVDRYGASAADELVLAKYGFTVDNVIAKAKALLG